MSLVSRISAELSGTSSRESEQSPFDELPGLAKYVLGEQLGEGAFSTVRRCRHKVTNQEYAIKIIDNEKLSRFPDYRPESLMREVEILKKLRHPNVISLHAAFRSHRAIFLVTELATGGELFDHIIARGHYTEPDAREISMQVLQAVAYLHDQYVIHRDIKPENILVSAARKDPSGVATGPSVVKISDFGLAKHIGEGAQMAMTTCGTPTYSAPEVWRGAYTNKVDCYSVGVLVFVMLSGHFPKVNAEGPIFHGKVWGEVSADARSLVQLLMNPDPERRCSAKAALQHPWIVGEIPRTPLSSARERLRQDRVGEPSGMTLPNAASTSTGDPQADWSIGDLPAEPPTLAAPPKPNNKKRSPAAKTASSLPDHEDHSTERLEDGPQLEESSKLTPPKRARQTSPGKDGAKKAGTSPVVHSSSVLTAGGSPAKPPSPNPIKGETSPEKEAPSSASGERKSARRSPLRSGTSSGKEAMPAALRRLQ